MRIAISLILLLPTVITGFCIAQWKSSGGPTGGEVQTLAANGSTVLLGTATRGMFRSTDNGSSWSPVDSSRMDLDIRSIVASGSSMYAATSGNAVLRSSDNGATWVAAGPGLTTAWVLSVAASGSTVYAGTLGAGVFRSTDAGSSWTAFGSGVTDPILSLTLGGSNLFAGTSSGRIFRVSVTGGSWVSADSGYTGGAAYILLTDSSRLLTGAAGGLFASTDNGKSWSKTGLASKGVRALLRIGTSLFAGTSTGIFESTDGGGTWSAKNDGLRSLAVLSIARTVSPEPALFVGTAGGGVFRSTNGAATWTSTNAGLENATVDCFARSGTLLYAGTPGGMFRSSNEGVTWQSASTGLPRGGVSLLLATRSALIAVTDSGLYRSTDDGQSWVRPRSDLGPLRVTSLAGNDTIIFAGTMSPGGATGGGVFSSSDLGATWAVAGMAGDSITALCYTAQKVFAGTKKTTMYVSTDRGKSWKPVGAGLPSNGFASIVSIRGVLYAGGLSGGVFRSTNEGGQWESVGGIEGTAHSLASSGGNLFVSLSWTVIAWIPGAQSWTNVDLGLPRNEVLSLLADRKFLYAGTDGASVWKRPLAEMIGTFSSDTRSLQIVNVPLIAVRRDTLMVSNPGVEPLIISSVSSDNARFGVSPSSATLLPGSSVAFIVTFSPTSTIAQTGNLVFVHSGADAPDTVVVNGTAANPIVAVIAKPEAGKDANVAFVLDKGVSASISSSTIFLRVGGGWTYDSLQLSRTGDSLRATLPARVVTLRGIYYYLRLRRADSVVVYTGGEAMAVDVPQYVVPLTMKKRTFNMVSVPMELTDSSPANVLQESFGDYNKNTWRLFRWESGRYAELPAIPHTFAPGTAFWLITNSGGQFTVRNARSVTTAQPLALRLDPGWNQIANPFPFPVLWMGITNSTKVSSPYYFNGSEYQPGVWVLRPWEGYFVQNPHDTVIVLGVPPTEGETIIGTALGEPDIDPMEECKIQFSARTSDGKFEDTFNYVGFRKQAAEVDDQFDYEEPPPISDGIRLSIVDGGKRYMANFKPPPKNGWRWDLVVQSAVADRQLHVTLQKAGKVEPAFDLRLLDMDNGRVVDVSRGEFFVQCAEQNAVRTYRVLIGTRSYCEQQGEGFSEEPLQTTVHQNYPNPFNPSTKIGYRLQAIGITWVKLSVYDMLGREVAELVNEEKPSGTYEVTWDATNAATGVYVYRLTSGAFSESRKMIHLK